MAKEYLDLDGLRYLWQKIKNVFAVKADSIKNITRSGTTFTATRADGTTFTFTQQDNNTWNANAVNTAGYVAAPTTSNANKVWKTDANGVPAWRNDSDTIYTLPAASSATRGGIRVGSGLGISSTDLLAVDGATTAGLVFDQLTASSPLSFSGDYENGYTFEISEATTSAAGTMSASDKTKLNGIATGAEVNQNAFSNVVVGSTTIAADGKTDTFTLVAGSNVTLTPDASNDKVTIAATNTTYNDFTGATSSAAGVHGLVPAPAKNDYANMYVLLANGTWGLIDNVIQASVAESSSGAGYVKINSDGSLTAIAGNTANNVAVLDSSGKIPTSLLPSYVDDVIEAYARSGATALSSTWLSTTSGGSALTPETGKIYVLMADSGDYAANSQFRWSGSAYVKLADGGVSSITNAEIDDIIDAA